MSRRARRSRRRARCPTRDGRGRCRRSWRTRRPSTVGRVDLVTFLLTRIAQDEAAAHAANGPPYNGGGLDEHFARWIPVRVLLECQTKRRLIEAIQDGHSDAELDDRLFLRMLALPYQDHADYQQEWARP